MDAGSNIIMTDVSVRLVSTLVVATHPFIKLILFIVYPHSEKKHRMYAYLYIYAT